MAFCRRGQGILWVRIGGAGGSERVERSNPVWGWLALRNCPRLPFASDTAWLMGDLGLALQDTSTTGEVCAEEG